MGCRVCGSTLELKRTNLPFKISDVTIVIVKDLPVVQCAQCTEYLIDDDALTRVDELLSCIDSRVELAIIPFGA